MLIIFILNKNVDTPKEHPNNFILNQKLDVYITSLSKLMNDIFTSLPNLSVYEMIKEWMSSDIKFVAQLSKVLNFNKENQEMGLIFIAR